MALHLTDPYVGTVFVDGDGDWWIWNGNSWVVVSGQHSELERELYELLEVGDTSTYATWESFASIIDKHGIRRGLPNLRDPAAVVRFLLEATS